MIALRRFANALFVGSLTAVGLLLLVVYENAPHPMDSTIWAIVLFAVGFGACVLLATLTRDRPPEREWRRCLAAIGCRRDPRRPNRPFVKQVNGRLVEFLQGSVGVGRLDGLERDDYVRVRSPTRFGRNLLPFRRLVNPWNESQAPEPILAALKRRLGNEAWDGHLVIEEGFAENVALRAAVGDLRPERLERQAVVAAALAETLDEMVDTMPDLRENRLQVARPA